MSESIFFADLDPNQASMAASARSVRRDLLSRLLIWDSVVVSDSQMLQNPCFRAMMSPTVLQERKMGLPDEDGPFDDLEDWQRGFEDLLKSGLVEVACRSDGGECTPLSATWAGMHKRSRPVPFLTWDRQYADYLEKEVGYRSRPYDRSRVADRFRSNLQAEAEKGSVPLSPGSPAMRDFERLISAESVNLADIKSMLEQRGRAGELRPDEVADAYHFCFRCYNINVPAELRCYLSAPPDQLPLFMESGTYDGVNSAEYVDKTKLRPSWAIDPAALDLLPLSAVAELRSAVQPELDTGLILKAMEGNLPQKSVPEYYDVWASYTTKLEDAMLDALYATKTALNKIMTADWIPAQEQFELGCRELVINHLVSRIPVVGEVLELVQLASELSKLRLQWVMFNQKQAEAYIRDYHDEIDRYMYHLQRSHGSIVTKYE